GAVGDEELGPVQDPVGSVLPAGGPDGGHVGACFGLGEGISPPAGLGVAEDAQEPLLLLRGPHQLDGRSPQAGPGEADGHRRIAPGQLLRGQHRQPVPLVLRGLPVPARRPSPGQGVQGHPQLFEPPEELQGHVALLVGLERHRPDFMLRHPVEEVPDRPLGLGQFKVDHAAPPSPGPGPAAPPATHPGARPSSLAASTSRAVSGQTATPKARASRSHFSTGWSAMYPWPPSTWTARSATSRAAPRAWSRAWAPPAGRAPRSRRQAPYQTRFRAASTAMAISATMKEIP